MGKIIVTTNVSLDGFVQDPDGQEGARLGGWFNQFGGKDLEEWAKVETKAPAPGPDGTIGDGLAFVTYEVAPDA